MNALKNRGFTLIELMVAITIIGILAAIVYTNFSGVREKGRDADRQADLRNMQIAIEQYKKKNGSYPEMGCDAGDGGLSAENNDKPCSAYIKGLAPEFIPVLPHDPKVDSHDGYAYVTNDDRSVYKVLAVGTVESEVVTNTHKFKRCDTSGLCSAADKCDTADGEYKTTYALWGGFAAGANDATVKTETAKVICK